MVYREFDVDLPEENEYPPWYIPEGIYPWHIYEASVKENKAGDGDYVQLGLETNDNGRLVEVDLRCSLKRKAVWKLKDVLDALGMPSSGKIRLNLDSLVNKWLMAQAVDKVFEGRLGTEIKEVYPMEGPPPDMSGLSREESEEELGLGLFDEDDDLPF